MRVLVPILLIGLAGCAAPLADVGRLSDQDLPDDTQTLEAVPGTEAQSDQKSGGFLARLLGRDTAPDDEVSDPTEFTLASGDETDLTEGAALDADGKTELESEAELASLTPPETFGVQRELEPAAKPQRSGLLGRLFSGGGSGASKGAVASGEVTMGTQLPYGQVAKVCDVPKSQLGKRVESFPERRATYALYDSEPGSTALRTFYLTGFQDGCARQFSAAVAVLGSASLHEQLRYGLPAEVQPYSDTDKAYEDLKVRVCNVPRRKPCGSKIGRLENNTVFVSIYERFGSNAQWSNLLVHKGALLAQDKKGS